MDRARGGGLPKWKVAKRPITLFVMSLCAFMLLDIDNYWALLACITGMFAGGTIGWGEPYGAYLRDVSMNQDNLESYQFFSLVKNNIMAALIFRGFIWGICFAGLAFFSWEKLVLIVVTYSICFPLALVIAKKIQGAHGWELSEWIRGALVGFVLWIARYV